MNIEHNKYNFYVKGFIVTMTIWTPELGASESDAKPIPRYRQIAESIGKAIETGELGPGDRLPPQRQLADRLNVTVGTITRAYNEAHHLGWVQSRVGSGTYVCDQNSSTASAFSMQPRECSDGVIDMSLSFAPPHPWRQQCLGEVLASIASDPATVAEVCEYQADIGTPHHRRALAAWLDSLSFPVFGSLVVTQGGQHGIDLCLRILTRPGELVAADALTYPGFNSAARHAHLKTLGIPLDEYGMDIAALERLCQRQVPSLVYVTPDQNNPTGVQLTEERRIQLAELARRHNFWIVEDSVQYVPSADRGTSMAHLAPERTLHIFSTSKLLSGGLRVGTLQVPDVLRERLGSALRAQSWMVPPLMVESACRWIASPRAQQLHDWQIEELQFRQELAQHRLAAYHPRGLTRGSNLWLPLPEGRRASEVHALLDQAGVRVATPEPFCTGSEPAPQALRLCVGSPDSRDALERALNIILEVLEDEGTSPWSTL